MFSAYELFGFMPASLAAEIIEQTFAHNKELYRVTLTAVAEARKLRPVFYERKPRVERHKDMVDMLSRPRLEGAASALVRGWLMKSETAMLTDFLDALGVAHKDGAVEDLPPTMDDAKLKAAVDGLLAKYAREKVVVYLHAFDAMNEVRWPNLKDLLEKDARLQLAA
jgi:hypothetical protein